MGTPRGVNQVRAVDPTRRQIKQRSAKIRRGWTPEEEQRRRADRVEPIVLAPIDWFTLTGMPEPEWDGCPI